MGTVKTSFQPSAVVDADAEKLVQTLAKILRSHVAALRPNSLQWYAQHAAEGIRLFEAACRMDLEGLVAKLAHCKYTPEASTWVKFKNPNYSQAEGRRELFQARQRTCTTG